MISHVVSVLRPVVDEVVVVASEDLELPALDARVVRDRKPALGPLAGIREGLENIDSEFAFVTATDAPFLSPAFVNAILSFRCAAALEIDGHVQTLAAVYPRRAVGRIDAMLADGNPRPLHLLEQLGYRRLRADELPDVESVRGFNTPDEYLAAVRAAGAAPNAMLEFQGRARRAMGCCELEVPVGTLAEVLAPVQASIDVLEGNRVGKEFSILLAGRSLVANTAIPIGPGERVLVRDAVAAR